MTYKRRRLPQGFRPAPGHYEITLICPICEYRQTEVWPELKSPGDSIKCDGCGHLVAESGWRLAHYTYAPDPPGGA